MKKAGVYVKFPKTGLGNMLLTWSRAVTFAHLNDLPLVTSAWGRISWGAWLRWERKKRTYWGYFKENSRWERWRSQRRQKSAVLVMEPAVERLPQPVTADTVFVFDQVSPGKDLFGPFRAHRELVRKSLLELLLPAMKSRLEGYEKPVIAVHIRRGDFKYGNPITPTSFFIDAILLARKISGRELPVTVFSDAAPAEIADVLSLPSVRMTEDKPDILDILLMSKCSMIVLSQSSTFSYWGAFLSDALIVKPEGDWQTDIRPADVNERLFEGKIDFQDPGSVEKFTTCLRTFQW